MKSTRGKDIASIDEAIRSGLAKDGGLYVPEQFPPFVINDFYYLKDLCDFSAAVLAPFFKDSVLKIDRDFCQEVFSFPLPLHPLSATVSVLELFHGPTLSFKDFGARFFARCLEELGQGRLVKVLVATSGDTGSAVASALHNKRAIEGIILFPKNKISSRQQAQIACWGDNIQAVAVNGSFEQCQQLVKMAFANREHHAVLTTANSINIARLLPQIIFYAHASIHVAAQHGEPANFIVPSGNLGNVTACYWAKCLGFPINEILIANNANQVLSDYLMTGIYKPIQSIQTLANAMDVGHPSNLERLIHLFADFAELKHNMNVKSVNDEEIKKAIINCYTEFNYLICPHTATAYHRLSEVDLQKPWVISATAHPAKFNEVIEPLLDCVIEVPESLQKLLQKKQQVVEIEPEYQEFLGILMQ
jgi:threonine synthase